MAKFPRFTVFHSFCRQTSITGPFRVLTQTRVTEVQYQVRSCAEVQGQEAEGQVPPRSAGHGLRVREEYPGWPMWTYVVSFCHSVGRATVLSHYIFIPMSPSSGETMPELAPGICCSGPEFTQASGARTGGPVLLDPDGSHAGLDHCLHRFLPRRRGVRKNWTMTFNLHTTSTGIEDCCWVKKRLDLIIDEPPISSKTMQHEEELAPGICCSGPEFTQTSGARTGGPVLLDPDGSHAGFDHCLHRLLPRRRGVRKAD
ncbi:uncharacterized protein LOC115030086 isoform X2 [Mus caroli]|uniref:Uncharacterized protein LOC115030086 isoform X2 n=1 Tax=Mus caroli TaxID=10089 RepID=A0A6P7QLA1_MUSCR|nr:uncharacterized protein LOC115030086 isoform X2 [Mus caroli]